MNTKNLILKLLHEKGVITTADVVKRVRISRQTAAQHFRELMRAGKLAKINSTRNAKYVPFDQTQVSKKRKTGQFKSRYANSGLAEDRVFQELELRMGLKRLLSPQAHRIVGYAFTEMLNNAVDHSKAAYSDVVATVEHGQFEFEVVDRGIGVFESLKRKFHLKDHFEAVSHLLKGKQTTDPVRHSGQGIFFTSKIADQFVLESSGISLLVDNVIADIAVKDIRALKGTRVRFKLKQKSRKNLKALFDDYSNANFEFDRTQVLVKLSAQKDECVSRSQAKRLLFGLEKFKRIVLDFKGVPGIGQGFADEVFRVFQGSHPAVRLEPVGMSPSVAFMVKRALRAG